jgi:hypothetical protein
MNMTELPEKDQNLYKCDKCAGTFKAVEAKLVDPADNVEIFGYAIMCVEKDGAIVSKCNPKKANGDKMLACPHCETIHLNGFDRAK